ncbi:MAG: malto-oligosyltrehalose trehalohydrolase [Vicinamibacterales bacterium]
MRRHPVGAEVRRGATSFRVWAPGARAVSLSLGGDDVEMAPDGGGYFRAEVKVGAGQRYGFKLDGRDDVLPDPASRFQPEGPHALSQTVDPAIFAWRHTAWTLGPMHQQVVYEMHIGTFTREGTWTSAAQKLPALKDIGITLLEVMPVAEFPGAFGWGYDGVQWFAPYHGYGVPDDFRAFIDAAHGLGLGVVLDVVYNHFGPDGNYAAVFAPPFISRTYKNEWGDALNFDGDGSEDVRAFARANVRSWIEEFRLDGFRFDAVQQIFDASAEHLVAELTREARAAAAGRELLIFGEHEPQHAMLARRPEDGGYGMDAIWNDDFHHAAVVALTGSRAAYYSDYEGSARELVAAARHGFLFQGQHYAWQKNARGKPALDLPVLRTVCYLENHDQVANSAAGQRLHQRASAGGMRAMTALLLLGPWVPLLFQGQEFGSSRPFLFFADHRAPLSNDVAKGRGAFMAQFRHILDPEIVLAVPHDKDTFVRCVLDDDERTGNSAEIALHRDLIALRQTDPVLADGARVTDGSAFDADRLVLRFHAARRERLLVLNLGATFDLARASDPLVAPPAGGPWRVLWHSERPIYGGSGMPPLDARRWEIPGRAAVLLGENV